MFVQHCGPELAVTNADVPAAEVGLFVPVLRKGGVTRPQQANQWFLVEFFPDQVFIIVPALPHVLRQDQEVEFSTG